MRWWHRLLTYLSSRRRNTTSHCSYLTQEQSPVLPSISIPAFVLQERGILSPAKPPPFESRSMNFDERKSNFGECDKETSETREEISNGTLSSVEGEQAQNSTGVPLRAPSFSTIPSVHSVMSDIQSRLHHLPRWKYRFLCASLLLAVILLGLLLCVSIVYGFGLKYVHLSVTGTTPLAPNLVDAEGNAPIRATISLDNPNSFPITASASEVVLSYMNGQQYTPLASAPLPRIQLHARHKDCMLTIDFVLAHLPTKPEGKAIMGAVLQGRATFLHAAATLRLHVRAFGFIRIVRRFEIDCSVATLWGEPTKADGSKDTVSDCFGAFV